MPLRFAALAAGLALVLSAGVTAHAQDAAPQSLKGDALAAAFRSLGISFEAPADQPLVLMDSHDVYGGDAVAGARGDMVLLQQGGHPCQYAMVLDRAAAEFDFNRSNLVAGPTGVTHPVWTATAMDANGHALSSVGEAEIRSYSDVPAHRFILSGPGITRVVFWGDDKGVDGFCNVVTDTVDVGY